MRLREAKAGLKWLEYGEKLGLLVRISSVLPVFEESAQLIKSGLRDMPGRLQHRLAAETDPTVVESILQQELEDLFEQAEKVLTAKLWATTARP